MRRDGNVNKRDPFDITNYTVLGIGPSLHDVHKKGPKRIDTVGMSSDQFGNFAVGLRYGQQTQTATPELVSRNRTIGHFSLSNHNDQSTSSSTIP